MVIQTPVPRPGLPAVTRRALSENFDNIQDDLDILELAVQILDLYAVGTGRNDGGTVQLVANTDVVVPFLSEAISFNSTIVLAAGTVSLDIPSFAYVEVDLSVSNLTANNTTAFAIQLLDDSDVFQAEIRDDIVLQGSETFAEVRGTFDVDDVPAGFKFRLVMDQVTGNAANVTIENLSYRVQRASRTRSSTTTTVTGFRITPFGMVGPP